MNGVFQITCNFCGSFYHGAPANQLAKMPPAETFVRASVPLCPCCVDDPARIKQVRDRVRQRLAVTEIAVHLARGRPG